MGKKDSASFRFFSKNKNFASLCNGYLWNGAKVMLSKELSTENTRHGVNKIERYVDVTKLWNKHNLSIGIIALENQNKVDYSMVIRNMLNEAIMYNEQLVKIDDYHKEIKDLKDGEYLCGFSKTDMIVPVIIIVVYLGEERWDGAKSLYELMDIEDKLKPFVCNHYINILDYHDYDNFDSFDGDVKVLLSLLASRDNKEKMKSIMLGFESADLETAYLLGEILDIKNIAKYVEVREEGSRVNMCKAWEDQYNSGVMDGEKIGEKRGEKVGLEKGLRALIETIRDFLPDVQSVHEAIIKNEEYKNITLDDVKKYY